MAGEDVAAVARNSANNLIQIWVEAFSLVLTQIAGKPFAFEQKDPENAPETSEQDVFATITASGTLTGELGLRIPPAGASALAKIFAGQSGDAGLTDEDRAAVEELLRQVAGHVTSAAKQIWPEANLSLALAPAPTWQPAAGGWICSASGAPAQIAMQYMVSTELNAALAAPRPTQSDAVNTPSAATLPDHERLGFFMDLELEVILRFGGRDVLLKDILQLGPGSVLELDRDIHDPADLLLDGKLIARGAVIMVDGNFGLRVTEVLAGQQIAA